MNKTFKRALGEFLFIVGLACIIAITFFIIAMAMISTVEYFECEQLSALSASTPGISVNYEWRIFTGCLAQTENGRWVDSNDYYPVEQQP